MASRLGDVWGTHIPYLPESNPDESPSLLQGSQLQQALAADDALADCQVVLTASQMDWVAHQLIP